MRKMLKDRSFRLSMLLTFIFFGTGVAFLFLGLADYSWILFVLLPVTLGISISALPNKRFILAGAVIATVLLLLGLYVPGLSGLLCIVMALPLVVPLIVAGYAIGVQIRRRDKNRGPNNFSLLLMPLLPFLVAAPAEHFIKEDKEAVIAVKTERVYNYTPQQVYDAIKSVDTLIAEKPFLMLFDLPVPTKCVLEKEEVGGLRTCYFDGGKLSHADFGAGTIVEKITRLEKAKVLQMDVIAYHLVGRKWLGFKEAIYYFDSAGINGCKLTRITTYTSVLTPRAYWEPLERLGIRQEHDYVLNNLQNDLERKYGK